MNQMEGYKEMLAKLTELLRALEQGELTLEELTALESVTRQLHERSIILRYKAFESSVLGEKEELVEVEETEEVPEISIEPDVAEEIPETEDEPLEETPFDFAIFDNDDDAEDEMEEETPEVAAPDAVAEVVKEVEEVDELPEPAKEEVKPSEPIKEVAAAIEPEQEAEEVEAEKEAQEEPATPKNQPIGSSFLDKLAAQSNPFEGRFSAGPLNSLIGAFGLNERLRFINDLFDGSSEKFSDAIKTLDSQTDLDAARSKAAGYADENEWDAEEEVVIEFMNYIKRRYA